MQIIAAIYVRVSKDDLNSDVSSSISNQIKVLKDYANNNNYIIQDVYIDDGYSGSTMDRPSFIKLLKNIEDKKLNTLLVKDISRIGRNYIHVGNFIENYIPANNIRLISLNDNYDSLNYNDDDSIVLRSFLNDYYLKECKKKAKQAVERRANNSYMTTGGIYGYIYDDNKNIVIDETAAKIVKRIYNEYNNNKKVINIITDLTNEKIPTPGYQSFLNYNKNRFRVKENNYYKWTTYMIDRILNNEEYTGISINKHKIMNNGIQIINKAPVKIENTHVAIISKEQFEKTKLLRASKHYAIKNDLDNLRLKSLIYCEKCNKPMFFNYANKSVYKCSGCKQRCSADDIHSFIFNDCDNVIKDINIDKNKFKKKIISSLLNNPRLNEINKLKQSKDYYDNQIEKLFEKKLNGDILNNEYQDKMVILKEILKTIEKELEQIDASEFEEKYYIDQINKFIDNVKKLPLDDKLEVARRMISKVYFNKENKKILIKYKFMK